MRPAASEELESLTAREREVLELLVKGLSNANIGCALEISPKTAKNHVAALLKKLNVANRTEAVGMFGALLRPGSAASPAGALPPAIAVLRMQCPDSDLVTRRLADGVVDDLITRLSRRWYPVIARCSTFSVIDSDRIGAAAIGAKLGARYLVEGSLSRFDTRLRCIVNLVDVEQGHVVWGERYDRRPADVFALLDELSCAIMEAVFFAAARHMAHKLEDVPQAQLLPWQIAVRGMWCFWQCTAEHNAQARSLFSEALKAEADQRLSLYGTALTHQREIYEQWSPDPDASVRALAAVSKRFLTCWPDEPWALLMSAYTDVYQGDRDAAIANTQRALDREPSSLGGRSLYGQLLAMDGQSSRAVAELEKALQLSPHTPERWVQECVMALAYFAGEAYEDAAKWGEAAAKSSRAGAMAHGVLASSYYYMGEREKAKSAHTRLLQLAPTFSNARFRPMLASTRQAIATRYLAGIQGAAAS